MDWLYDNRSWLFEGIGVVILVGLAGWLWRRLTRTKAAAPAKGSPDTRAGVVLDNVKVKDKASISGVSAPEVGVIIERGTYGELNVEDVEVRPGAATSGTPPSLPIVGSQFNKVQAHNLTSVTHVHLPDDPARADPAVLRRAYLGYVLAQADQLPLSGVDRQTASSTETQLQLSAVYTALLTQTPEPIEPSSGRTRGGSQDAIARFSGEQARRLSAVDQLNRHARLVLLGGPGSGKSTFVSFVTLCLAGAQLSEPLMNLDLLTAPLPVDEEHARRSEDKPERQPWAHGPLLPVRVVLRDFAARGLPPPGTAATVEHLWQFLESELAAASLADYVPYLRKEVMDRGGLLLLDGLDEVPEADERRAQIKQVVAGFSGGHRKCRIMVTSRTYAYQNQDWRLPGFAEAVLEPFTRQQIRVFVDRWYEHIATVRHRNLADMQGRAELLKQRVFANERLYALAEQPLLLTLMASLHAWRGGSLPERRVELYADAVDLLLEWWENQRVVRNARGETQLIQPSLAEFLRVDRKRILQQLYRLAFEAHARQPTLTGTADIAEADLVQALLSISDRETKQVLLLEYLNFRAGLLAPRGIGVYTLPHRTFQEYLAACHLTDDDFPAKLADLVRSDPQRWREVVLLAGAKAAGGAASTIWSLVDALCFLVPTDAEYSAADHWGALLAGQALVEAADLVHVHKHNQPKLERVRQDMLYAMRGTVLPATDRALGGQVLAKLSDPRVEVLDPLAMEMCCVPAGPFVMGDGKEQHQQDVAYPYWIGRYPVTVAQYGAFAAAGGYAESRYWVEAAQAGLWQQGQFRERDRPYSYGEPYELANHPVVGTSWYEALAFVRWLNEVSTLPAGYALRLPSEPEWEKAARGGLEVAAEPVVVPLHAIGSTGGQVTLRRNELPERQYPWGDKADIERANYDDTKIGSTSAVGCFPGGVSPYGVEELSGNVWEWTRSLWADYPYPASGAELVTRENLEADAVTRRVVRGGAF